MRIVKYLAETNGQVNSVNWVSDVSSENGNVEYSDKQ